MPDLATYPEMVFAPPSSEARPTAARTAAALLEAGFRVRIAAEGGAAWPTSPAAAEQVLAAGRAGHAAALDAAAAWMPWFPVLDRRRCNDCRQCLNFCLFDVYMVDEAGRVVVSRPANCKTDCPACARVCPQAAIIFPKYAAAPINGAEVSDEAVAAEGMQSGIEGMLAGNLAENLRRRGAAARQRFSLERDRERAEAERCQCMQTVPLEQLGVPRKVIESLPLDELKQKAAERLSGRPAAEGPERGDR